MIDFSKLEQYRENNRIEAKKALGGLPRSIWETYSAFANTLGGIILLGVVEQPDRTLRAIQLPDPEGLARQFWQQLSDPCQASVNILSKRQVRVEQADGKRIVAITVPRAPRLEKPVYIDGDPLNGTYRRSGEGDYRCTRDEVEAMLEEAAVRTPDMQVMGQVPLAKLDAESIRRYRLRMQRLQPGSVWEGLEDPEFLYQMGASGMGEDRSLHPTAAGLWMFGRAEEICRFFPHYRLEYREEEFCLCSGQGDWSGNLYEFYFRVCERLTRGLPGGAPVERALREALANCLVNADYRSPQGVRVLRRGREIRLRNSGDFRIGVSDALAGGISNPRNAALIRMFGRVRVGGGTGSGIPQIYAVWKAHGWPLPRIQQSGPPAQTTLCLEMERARGGPMEPPGPVLLQLYEQIFIDYLTDHTRAELRQLADCIDLSPARARRSLDELVEAGILTAEGSEENPVYSLRA